jgi:hypothetical protein
MKQWKTPELVRFGSLQEMTRQAKDFVAPADGFMLQGMPLGDVDRLPIS